MKYQKGIVPYFYPSKSSSFPVLPFRSVPTTPQKITTKSQDTKHPSWLWPLDSARKTSPILVPVHLNNGPLFAGSRAAPSAPLVALLKMMSAESAQKSRSELYIWVKILRILTHGCSSSYCYGGLNCSQLKITMCPADHMEK